MAIEFKIPELGENVSAGDVVRVLVKPGDTLAKDQAVLELETDKATIEVPSSVEGTVEEVKVKSGERVKVGQVVLTVGDAAPKSEAAPTEVPKDAEKPNAAEKPETAKPKPQPTGAPEEGGLSQEAVPEEASPARVEAPVEKADEPRKRGEVVDISRGARPPQTPQAPASEETRASGTAAPAAPSVRRIARELGVDIASVNGSGEGGRISVDDVHDFVRGAMDAGGKGSPSGAGQGGAQPLPDFSKWGPVERQPMSNIRRKTAEHLSRAWNTIPHVTQHDRTDITNLEALRKEYGPQAEKAGGKLTMTAIALKVIAGALKKFPQFNASADSARSEIIYKKAIHIGVAVDTERGLLVPVVRDVDRKGILELASELAKASEKARAGKLSLDEMQGGGFTITNLGGIGGTSFTPIVNWPEVAILGISRGSYEPVWNEHGQAFDPRLMLPLSLSYDHRVIDGADAARFLRWVCEAFEQPFVLAL
ncbi:MAG: 2-oxo acid dehydrogenase subunit E2 [Acidobacteria bacterium]|nr:2-oxo acid dehydrogenase subunit E2 [Acidobacteriota bacterium]